jgi:short-subunit dehydrogenase
MSCFGNKVVVITGAGSGIGRCLAQQCAAKGAQLAVSDVNADGLKETLASLPNGTKARSYIVDTANVDQVFAHAEEVKRDFGGAHFLFNNAGVMLNGTFDHQTIQELEWQVNINMWGVIYGCKAFLPIMMEQREGCLINISSVIGLIGFPLQTGYAISKFAIRGLTECLWSELEGTGVRAIVVHPGGTRTNIKANTRMAARAGAEEERYAGVADTIMRTSPEDLVGEILAGVERGDKRIVPGYLAGRIFWLSRLLPNSYDRLVKRMTK